MIEIPELPYFSTFQRLHISIHYVMLFLFVFSTINFEQFNYFCYTFQKSFHLIDSIEFGVLLITLNDELTFNLNF